VTHPEVSLSIVGIVMAPQQHGSLQGVARNPQLDAGVDPFGWRHLSETAAVDLARCSRCVGQSHDSASTARVVVVRAWI
jgi:hypothetical protein